MKNIFYFYNINSIGGVESMFYYLAKKYKDNDITVYYSYGDEKQIARLRKYIKVLKYNNETIGLFVATCDIPNILEEYQLDNNNVILIDSVMIREDFRGYGLQRQILDYLYNRYTL